MADLPISGPALVARAPGDVGLEERLVGRPASAQVLIQPHYVGICGTDLEIVEGTLDPAYVRYPLVLGHEWSGRVLALGENVENLAVGDAVVVEGIFSCGQCAQCRAGRTNMCESYAELGFTLDGAAGPAVVAPSAFVHRLGDNVPLDAGALVEPAAVVLRGLLELRLDPGLRVLVIGDGTVALLAANLVRMWSPTLVHMSGRRSKQRRLAESIGVDRFTIDPPEERYYDVVVEAAGSTSAVETAVRSAAPSGRILLLGIVGHGNAANVLVDDVVNHDLTIRGSFSYTASAWNETVGLLNSGRFQPLSLVTHRFPLSEYAAALHALKAGGEGPRGKILLELGEERFPQGSDADVVLTRP